MEQDARAIRHRDQNSPGPQQSSQVGARSVVTVAAIVERAKGIGVSADDMAKLAHHIAERAEAVATRLTGPYPSAAIEGPSASGREEQDHRSMMDAMFQSVADAHPRVMASETPLKRIGHALEMIERALG